MAGFRVNPGGSELVQGNAVITGRSQTHYFGPFEGTLSIKTVLSGETVWSTPDGRHRVSPECHLILNEGQSYLEIEVACGDP